MRRLPCSYGPWSCCAVSPANPPPAVGSQAGFEARSRLDAGRRDSPQCSATSHGFAEQYPDEDSIRAWFGAGVAVVGIGASLVRKEWVQAKDFAAITAKTAEVIAWIRQARGGQEAR